ncbi:MAG: CusA/CzcA family heavy metal efflux RND transporter [Cryomorphaceae bacterium]|nr:CusA/CzcA family heavy metal efflux RND transporter [Cryomorphaceae bacterium]
MFTYLIEYSLKNKLIVLLATLALVLFGVHALFNISIDAVPDITNNQVQVVTTSPSLAPQEVEKFITYPLEIAMANLPEVEEIRSISRYGLSVVTVVFAENVPTLDARQYVKEKIDEVRSDIPETFGRPELMPITTGLGEIYQYVLKVDSAYSDIYDITDLRTIQDWIVKRQLAGIPGIVDVSSFGGYLKQYEVAVDPYLLSSLGLTLVDVFNALSANNQNTGGSYIEKGSHATYIRTEGLIQNLDDVRKIHIATTDGVPIRIEDIGEVRFGAPPRFGAMTMDGNGETVGGITLMLKGENAYKVNKAVIERIEDIQRSLPQGISIYPYLERSGLIKRTIQTVRNNLLEGGAIVIIVLVLLLGNFRAGLIVASIIPLSMLFALILMYHLGVSANLMSLGAIDFGIVVDSAVVIVENLVAVLTAGFVGKTLSQKQLDSVISKSATNIYKSAAFGVLTTIVVFIPVMTLSGIEGKMFRPMAQTLTFALIGTLLLSLTYIPVISSILMRKTIKQEGGLPYKIIKSAERLYEIILKKVIAHNVKVFVVASILLIAAIFGFYRLGSEFIPDLEEGDLAVQVAIQPGSSLKESIATASKVEKILKEHFPEVIHVVSKIGTAEIPTDPMAMEDMDVMIVLKEKEQWVSAKSREELVDKMKDKLNDILGVFVEFSQPIQLRFNELMTGAKTDIAIKIYGEDMDVLFDKANEAARLIQNIPGADDIKVEQTDGLPQMLLRFNREALGRYGVTIDEVNMVVRTAFAGTVSGLVYEGQRRFDLVVRLNEESRDKMDIGELFVNTASGQKVLLRELVDITFEDGPMQISRDNTKRRINIGVNVRNRDVASLVADIENRLYDKLSLPPGYHLAFGGQFENLQKATSRLKVAIPIALAMIFLLLYFAFGTFKYMLMIGTSVPFSAIGGVAALYLRGMPFSISAGIGFVALFGVAVLNGIVLISAINQLRDEKGMPVYDAVLTGARTRLRPVLMTGLVAALGFIPMALSTSAGAEVQKPLATVVIGGIVSDTILTLLLLPIFYLRFPKRQTMGTAQIIVLLLLVVPFSMQAQPQSEWSLQYAKQLAYEAHPMTQNARLRELQAAEERKRAIQMDNFDVSYQYGQFNTRVYDYYIEANQNFGSILQHIRRGAFARELQDMRKNESVLSKRQLSLLVESAWYEWLTRKTATERVDKELEQLESFLTRVDKLEEAGEISPLEQQIFRARLASFRNFYEQQNALLIKASNQLRLLTGFEGEMSLPQSFEPLPLPSVEQPIHEDLIAVEKSLVEIERRTMQVEQASLFPDLTAGYFNQEIEAIPNFQGVMVGLQFPLWFRPQRAKIQQAKLQIEIAQNDLEFAQRNREAERLNAVADVLAQYNQWKNYGVLALKQSEKITQTAYLSYESGEIDFFQFAESLRTSLELNIETLEILNRYNQSVILFNFYAADSH